MDKTWMLSQEMTELMINNQPDSEQVTQLFPEKRQVPLEGLYLGQRLADLSAKIGKTLVITDFLTDRNGIIAVADERRNFRVPLDLRNASDWRLFQELLAQADVIISGEAYLKRLSVPGSQVEDVLSQFEPGKGFEDLGEWRLGAGYKKRSPDLAIVTRSLDFKIPQGVLESSRRITIFTTLDLAASKEARALTSPQVSVVGSGEAGVEGERMVDYLDHEMGYRIIMMATGPRVLQLLLKANRLDLLFITEAQMEIAVDDPSSVQVILPEGKKINELKEFSLTHQYLQENVVTKKGSHISQVFLRYDRKGLLSGRAW